MTESSTLVRPPADYTASITTDSPPGALFHALTTTAGLAAWWTPVAGDGSEGGELRFDMHAPEGPLVINVRTSVRPNVVVWDVRACPFLPDWEGTTITFDLGRNSHGGCDLFFRHHGLTPQLECYEMCRQGWDHFLPSLRSYVDNGSGDPLGSDADNARRTKATD